MNANWEDKGKVSRGQTQKSKGPLRSTLSGEKRCLSNIYVDGDNAYQTTDCIPANITNSRNMSLKCDLLRGNNSEMDTQTDLSTDEDE